MCFPWSFVSPLRCLVQPGKGGFSQTNEKMSRPARLACWASAPETAPQEAPGNPPWEGGSGVRAGALETLAGITAGEGPAGGATNAKGSSFQPVPASGPLPSPLVSSELHVPRGRDLAPGAPLSSASPRGTP